MNVTQMQYTGAKELFEAVQRQPAEAQREILTMLRGAIAISDLYTAQTAKEQRSSA